MTERCPVADPVTQRAAIVIRLDIDANGEVVTQLMRQINALLPPGGDAWIGIKECAAAVDELLVSFGRAGRG